jgi:serine/alanine adding enzyme
MNTVIKIISNPDKGMWRNFVDNHPQGNIFQTPEMVEVYKKTKNYLPLTLAAIDTDSDEIQAIVNAALIHEFGESLKSFTSRSIIIGGPLYHDNLKGWKSVRLLMEQYDAIVSGSSLYTEIRNLWDTKKLPLPQDYTYEQHLNFLVDLSGGKENLWKNLSKPRRYGINKSRKMGVTIREISSENELDTLYLLLKDTYNRARHPIPDKSLFDAVYSYLVPKNLGKIFFACYENKLIGAIVLLLYKQKIYDWYSCSLKDCSKFYPNDILVWHTLEWGSSNDYIIFDFMGAGKPEEKYGVREFKRQFGGPLVNFGRYKKVHSPIKYSITQSALAGYKLVGKYF